MKRIISLVVLLSVVCGLAACCGPSGVRYPLQPGEKIIFESAERAAEFRRISGNDFNPLSTNTGRVVKIEGVVILEAH